MKANELMIGDWVYGLDENGNKYKCQITELSKHDFYTESSELPEGWENGDSFVEIEPIPITPEILEKNGWYHGKFDGSYGRKAMRLDGLHKDKLPDGVDNALSFAQWSIDEKFEYHLLDVYLWKGSVHLWIEYVHELQHALKLCGIEKTIEL